MKNYDVTTVDRQTRTDQRTVNVWADDFRHATFRAIKAIGGEPKTGPTGIVADWSEQFEVLNVMERA